MKNLSTVKFSGKQKYNDDLYILAKQSLLGTFFMNYVLFIRKMIFFL